MAKKEKGGRKRHTAAGVPSPTEEQDTGARLAPKMKRGEYERELRTLHGELVAMQEWVRESGAKICVVFEGRDTAGKGGTIKAITERVSPRVFHVAALPTPTERERTQMYVQRYVQHFPAAGEVVIFDRSWYNRAGVERVMGFCKPEETDRFLDLVPGFEKAMAESGILLVKYWLEVSPAEQTRRLPLRQLDVPGGGRLVGDLAEQVADDVEPGALFVVGVGDVPGGPRGVGGGEHRVPGPGVVIPAAV